MTTIDKVLEVLVPLVLGLVILALALPMTGCAGIRIGADIARIDEAQESHAMSAKGLPWKCMFVNCNQQGS